MKKILLIASLLLAGMTASAQLFLGGSIGFDTRSEKDNDDNNVGKSTNFTFGPEVGYAFDEKFEVGLGLNLGLGSMKVGTAGKVKSNNFRIAPFVRYSFVEFGNFSILGRGEIYVGHSKSLLDEKTTNLGFAITPVLKYKLNDNFSLFTNLNFASLSLDYSKEKDAEKTTEFGFGVNSGNVFNVGAITVGFNYYF